MTLLLTNQGNSGELKMKVRNGFVTNSSSSSFILQFKNVPKTVEEVRDIFFEGYSLDDQYDSEDSYYNYNITVGELCQIILKDLKEPQTFEEVYESEGVAWELGDFHKWVTNKTGVEVFTFYEEDNLTKDNIVDKLQDQFNNEMKNQAIKYFTQNGLNVKDKFYTLEYEDRGREGILEHDEILETKGIRISRH